MTRQFREEKNLVSQDSVQVASFWQLAIGSAAVVQAFGVVL